MKQIKDVLPLVLMRCMFCLNEAEYCYEAEAEAPNQMANVSVVRLTPDLESRIRRAIPIRKKTPSQVTLEELKVLDTLVDIDVWQVLLDEIDKLRSKGAG